MKKTALSRIHQQLGARMIPFAGYLMTVEFTGVNEEHIAVRKNVGVFDVSHMGEFWVTGPNAFDLVQWVTSNDVSKLVDGKIQYTCFPNGKGGIIDDLLVYRFNDEKYLLVVNASNIEKDWKWINSQNRFGATLENVSDSISQLAVQGPNAARALQNLTEIDLEKIAYYTFMTGEMAGIQEVIISATGYTGAGGFELYCDRADTEKLWNAIFVQDASLDIKPIGLAARDTLRLEMGFCLYGNDIDDTTSPIEAGLGWITKFNPENQFIDREFLKQQKEDGTTRKLVGFILEERGIPRQHYEIRNQSDERIGMVTSGTMSPMIKQGIGMGYVQKDYAAPETRLYIRIRDRNIPARVIRAPFYKG